MPFANNNRTADSFSQDSVTAAVVVTGNVGISYEDTGGEIINPRDRYSTICIGNQPSSTAALPQSLVKETETVPSAINHPVYSEGKFLYFHKINLTDIPFHILTKKGINCS